MFAVAWTHTTIGPSPGLALRGRASRVELEKDAGSVACYARVLTDRGSRRSPIGEEALQRSARGALLSTQACGGAGRWDRVERRQFAVVQLKPHRRLAAA